MRYILTANNITKCFFKDGKKFNAVDNVSFFLDKNEFCSLVGESGSGKTTLVRIISGLISPDSGTVVCDGESLTPRLRRKNKVICAKLQLVLQNSRAALDPRFSVYESIAEPIKNLKKCSRDEERKTVEKFIEQMELPKSILSQRSGELSGGQQKRVCIARALAADPDYIIFDEAVSGLDAVVRKNVLDLLIKIQKNSGKGCLLITHDIDAALYISQRIAVMKSGRILESVNYSGNIQVFKSEYAKKVYKRIKENTFATMSEKLYQQGYTLYSSGDYGNAIKTLKEAVKYDETNVKALYFLGRGFQKQQKYDKAKKYYETIINDFPDSDRVALSKAKLTEMGY